MSPQSMLFKKKSAVIPFLDPIYGPTRTLLLISDTTFIQKDWPDGQDHSMWRKNDPDIWQWGQEEEVEEWMCWCAFCCIKMITGGIFKARQCKWHHSVVWIGHAEKQLFSMCSSSAVEHGSLQYARTGSYGPYRRSENCMKKPLFEASYDNFDH